MSKHLRILSLLALVSALLLGTVSTVLAGDDTYIYGLVFIDSDLDGVWDADEEGYSGEWQEYWEDDELIQRYVGTTVTLTAGDEDNPIVLETAGSRILNEDEVDLCTYQDYLVEDGADEDDAMDVNLSPARPCTGSWGLRPAGDNGTVWKVTVTAPEGYVLTTSATQYVTVDSSGVAPVDIGIAPAGAGGVSEASIVEIAAVEEAPAAILMPATGGSLLLGLAGVAAVYGGTALAITGSKMRH